MSAPTEPAADLSAGQAQLIEQEVAAALRTHEAVADCAVLYRDAAAAARRCTRCGISERYPGIGFDRDGVCSLCTMYAANRDRIHAYFGHLDQMVQRIRARSAQRPDAPYDCLLLFSGGKDSTYVLHQLVDLGLRVMTFTFDNGFISRTALSNVEEITNELGIEHVTATHADQNKVFLLSLREHKSVCNGCFRSLLDLSTELAHERGIPSIVTGLSRGQIIDERLSWFYHQGVFDPAEIEPKLAIGRRVYHQAGGTIAAAAVDAVEVVDYFRYSEVSKDEIRDYLQRNSRFWAEPKDTGFCSSNCMINDVGVYVHNEERGYHNYEAPTRWEVRVGHLGRAEADAELQPPVATARVKNMLAHIGYPDPAAGGRIGHRLTAYYVPRGSADAEQLRAAVGRIVPQFLVPEQWVSVPRIPRLDGAVVRAELAAPAPTSRFGTELAEGGPAPARPAPAAGLTLPLAPAQQAFFASRPLAPDRQAPALLLQLPGAADPARLRKVALQLLLQHDALRLRFAQRDGQWRQRDGGVRGAVPVVRLDTSGRPEAEEPELLRAAAERLRSRLNLADGPVLQVAAVDRGSRPGWLLLVVHELVADTPSWRLLVADLLAAVEQVAAGAPVSLPVAGSFLGRAAALPEPVTAAELPEPAAPVAAAAAGSTAGLPESAPDGEPSRVRVGAGTGPLPGVDAVLAALGGTLTGRLGGQVLVVDVLDHTAARPTGVGPTEVGPLSTVDTVAVAPDGTVTRPAPPGSAAARVRYDHYGDLAGLLPAGSPATLPAVSGVDFTAPVETGPYLLRINGAVQDGAARLDWWCGEGIRDLLRQAGIPRRVGERLAGSAGGG
jgi:hypothetical protein